MKMLNIKGIAAFCLFLAAPLANAQGSDTMYFSSLTDFQDRVLIQDPRVVLGNKYFYISSQEPSGVCIAYGYSGTVNVEKGDKEFSRMVEFDTQGKVIRLGPEAEGTPIRSLICMKP